MNARKATALKSIGLYRRPKTHQLVTSSHQEPVKEIVFKSRNEPSKTEIEGRRHSKLGGTASSFIAKSKSPKINVHIQRTPNTTKNATHHNTDVKKRGLQSVTSKK